MLPTEAVHETPYVSVLKEAGKEKGLKGVIDTFKAGVLVRKELNKFYQDENLLHQLEPLARDVASNKVNPLSTVIFFEGSVADDLAYRQQELETIVPKNKRETRRLERQRRILRRASQILDPERISKYLNKDLRETEQLMAVGAQFASARRNVSINSPLSAQAA